MNNTTQQRIWVFGGIVLIVVYSVIMVATGGGATWAWLLLLAGLGAIFFSRRAGSIDG